MWQTQDVKGGHSDSKNFVEFFLEMFRLAGREREREIMNLFSQLFVSLTQM